MTGKDGQTGTPVAIATELPPNVSAAFPSQQRPFQVLPMVLECSLIPDFLHPDSLTFNLLFSLSIFFPEPIPCF